MFGPQSLSTSLLKTETIDLAEKAPETSEGKTQFSIFTTMLESPDPTAALSQFVTLVPGISASFMK